ncbi:CheR family methyltransferase [Desulfonatronum parangueonense]
MSDIFPIVGMGASAGGLDAFKAFFSAMPKDADPGMAFVLVMHLSADYKSMLTEILQRHTRLRVFEVQDDMVVETNCVYIIPPGRDMAVLDGRLHLAKQKSKHRQMSVDYLFRSMAQDLHERAIVLVFSGTGTDGTLGVQDVKDEGGLVMVQEPSTCEYADMPRSAIATGKADFVLPPEEMPDQLMTYKRHFFKKLRTAPAAPGKKINSTLKKILGLLRAQSGHDFSQYKPRTIHRRIERRIAVHHINTIEEYEQYLRDNPEEVEALFRDLLIGVTSFFRDPDAFKALAKTVIPKIIADKHEDGVIRVWVVGCSTGEEAYSLAMLLTEELQKAGERINVQIFGTDIDSRAISVARAGIYPRNIAEDVPPKRLRDFFTKMNGQYQVKSFIREMMVFSEHSVIKDPPFSKIDLISSRNLLIYLNDDLQKKVLPLFHYSLKTKGFLFLGSSESVGNFHNLFDTLDRAWKLYQKKNEDPTSQRLALESFLPSMERVKKPPHRDMRQHKPPLLKIIERNLLLHLAPSAVLVKEHGHVLYYYGRTGEYLEPSQGESGADNVVQMARPGLRRELAKALRNAVDSRKVVHHPGVHMFSSDRPMLVDLTVRPVARLPDESEEETPVPLFLVIMEKSTRTDHAASDQDSGSRPGGENVSGNEVSGAKTPATENRDASLIASLQRELQFKEESLRSAYEDLETSNEELQASYEELQSVNEELQSTNEELETSKEELQSVNEELTSVNSELQASVVELTRANNDMNNMLAGTGVGTVFVDMDLRIVRFTPAVTKVINLIQSDLGRPVNHVATNLKDYGDPAEDIKAVLDNLTPKELEVRDKSGKWYLMEIRPYRTMNNVIEGAVLTFVDISQRKQVERELREAKLREVRDKLFKTVFDTVHEPLVVLDEQMQVVFANWAFCGLFQVTPENTNGRAFYELGDSHWNTPKLHELLEEVLRENKMVTDFEVTIEFAKIGQRTVLLNARRIYNEQGQSEHILLAIRDVTKPEALDTGQS